MLFLFAVRGILGPFVWAAIVAYVFNPLVTWISRRTRLHRFWAVALLYAVAAAVVFWMVTYVAPSIRREAQQFQQDIPSLIGGLMEYLLGNDSVDVFGYSLDSQTLIVELTNSAQSIFGYLSGHAIPVVVSAFTFLGKLLMFLFVTFYLLLDGHRLGAFVRRAIPAAARDEITDLGVCIDHMLGRWVRGELLLVVIMTSATWVALSLLGVRYAIILALITGVLELFPLVGPVVAGAIACVVALFQPNPFGWSNLSYVLAIAAVYTALRYAEDYLVIPAIIGRIVEFHPLVVFFALFAGGSIAGMLGMFIAVPSLAILKVIFIYLYNKLVEEPEAALAAACEDEPARSRVAVAGRPLGMEAQVEPPMEAR